MSRNCIKFRTGAVAALAAVVLTGCVSDGDDGDRGSAGETGAIPLITSITQDDSAKTVITVVTDELIDLRFSTASDCDWNNVSLCDNGFIISNVGSEEVFPGAEETLPAGTQWFVKAGAGTPREQLATFTIPDGDEPVLFFGNSSSLSDLIRTSLNSINDEVILTVERDTSSGPSGLAADSENGWVYFSYVHKDDGSVIDRAKEDGSQQERVAEFDRLPSYLAIDTESEVLYASSFTGLERVDVSDSAQFGDISALHTSESDYGGIAWNPVTDRLVVVSVDNSDCRLSAVSPDGQLTELHRIASASESEGPIAIDTAEQVVFAEMCGPGNLIQKDLGTGVVSSLDLESYSGRGMVVDPVNKDLIYRGSLNTVRRQNLEDADDNEEILDEDKPSFAGSAAILLVPSN